MTSPCPECGHRANPVLFLGYLRLGSMPCPRCKTLLAIDGTARGMFWVALIVVALLAAITSASEVATAAVVVLGLAASAMLLARTATLHVAPDDPGRRSRD